MRTFFLGSINLTFVLALNSTALFAASDVKSDDCEFVEVPSSPYVMVMNIQESVRYQLINPFSEKFDNLSRAEQVSVADNKIIVKYGNESPWPRSTVFHRIYATPKETAAIFFDYTRHHEFFPSVIKSVIVNPDPSQPNDCPDQADIAYTLDLGSIPFLPLLHLGIENYTTRNRVNTDDTPLGKAYRIQWDLLHADTTQGIEGTATFLPFKDGGTLMIYDTLIVPGRFGSIMFVDAAKKSVQDCVMALIDRVEIWAKTHTDIVKSEIEALEHAIHL